jgi:hypothetical protein
MGVDIWIRWEGAMEQQDLMFKYCNDYLRDLCYTTSI